MSSATPPVSDQLDRGSAEGRVGVRDSRRHLRHAARRGLVDRFARSSTADSRGRSSSSRLGSSSRSDVLPAVLIAIPFGLVLVLEVGGLAVQIGASAIVGAVDAIGIVREAAPVITAILLSGAGGSAICADLGARTMRDEISAMWVMAVDPIERLVAPRVVATVVVALLVNGIVAFAGIMSGYLAAVFILHTSAGGFLDSFSTFAQPADAIESMFKAALFGLLAAVVASHKGLNAKRGPSGVGEAVNRSVVITGVGLFLLNLLVTDVFLAIVPPRVL